MVGCDSNLIIFFMHSPFYAQPLRDSADPQPFYAQIQQQCELSHNLCPQLTFLLLSNKDTNRRTGHVLDVEGTRRPVNMLVSADVHSLFASSRCSVHMQLQSV